MRDKETMLGFKLIVGVAVVLLALAANYFLGRYEMLLNDHGFMVGMDYTNQYFSLPLQWFVIVVAILSAISLVFATVSINRLLTWWLAHKPVAYNDPPVWGPVRDERNNRKLGSNLPP